MTGVIIELAIFLMIIFAPLLSPLPPSGETVSGGFFAPFLPPSRAHLLGTNNIGQDVFTRILYGGITPLEISLFSTAIAGGIGIMLGLSSGYRGGKSDRLMASVMDALYAFPGIVLAIAITSALGPNPLNTVVALAVVYVPSFFRMTRGQTMMLKEVPYVEAGRSLGESTSSILFHYILPSIYPAIVVISSLSFADAILTEAGLSFIGLPAITPPSPGWGIDLVAGKDTLLSGAWWMITFPGLMIVISVLGFSLFAEGLNEMYNLRAKSR